MNTESNKIDTGYQDMNGTTIHVGDTICNCKINFIEPRIWEVCQREDGLILGKGKVDDKYYYSSLDEIMNHPSIAVAVLGGAYKK